MYQFAPCVPQDSLGPLLAPTFRVRGLQVCTAVPGFCVIREQTQNFGHARKQSINWDIRTAFYIVSLGQGAKLSWLAF